MNYKIIYYFSFLTGLLFTAVQCSSEDSEKQQPQDEQKIQAGIEEKKKTILIHFINQEEVYKPSVYFKQPLNYISKNIPPAAKTIVYPHFFKDERCIIWVPESFVQKEILNKNPLAAGRAYPVRHISYENNEFALTIDWTSVYQIKVKCTVQNSSLSVFDFENLFGGALSLDFKPQGSYQELEEQENQ